MMSDYSGFTWQNTSAEPVKDRRYDDIWFHDDDIGWAVNANGLILKTVNGGATWSTLASLPQ